MAERYTRARTLPLARNGISASRVLAFGRARPVRGDADACGQHPGRTTKMPRAACTALQTGETRDALVLVALLTALSCVVLVVASRLATCAT